MFRVDSACLQMIPNIFQESSLWPMLLYFNKIIYAKYVVCFFMSGNLFLVKYFLVIILIASLGF